MGLLDLVPGLGWLRAARALAGRLFGPVWRWLIADWRHPLIAGFAVALLVDHLSTFPRLRDQRDAAIASLAAEARAHNETIRAFVDASRTAEAAQAGNIARVEQEQAEITGRITDDYQERLQALHDRAARLRAGSGGDRLRAEAAPAAGLSGAAALPGPGAAAGGADAAPGDPGLSATCSALNLEQRVTASEQALQLDALIDWNLAQAQVRTSPADEVGP